MPPKGTSESLVSGAVDADKVNLPIPPHDQNPRINALLSKQIMDCIQPKLEDRPDSMVVVLNKLELIRDVLNEPISSTQIVDGSTTFGD
jgi:hypothetical protein